MAFTFFACAMNPLLSLPLQKKVAKKSRADFDAEYFSLDFSVANPDCYRDGGE